MQREQPHGRRVAAGHLDVHHGPVAGDTHAWAAEGEGDLLAQAGNLVELGVRMGAQAELDEAGRHHAALDVAGRLVASKHCFDAVCLLF